MPAQNAISKTAIYAVVVVAVVGLFIYAMKNRDSGVLKLKTGNSELAINFSDNKLNLTDLLKTLLTDDKYKKDTLAILADSYGLYQDDSDKLIDEIRRDPGNSDFSNKIRDLLYKREGPFEQKYHHYYDITNPDTVVAINNLGYYSKVATKLRDMKKKSVGIFKPIVTVNISVSSDNKIPDGKASVCMNSSYRGMNLLLLNPRDRSKTLTVFARNNIACNDSGQHNQKDDNIIKINKHDAKSLFGDIVLSTKEKAILFPTQQGANFKPMVVSLNQ